MAPELSKDPNFRLAELEAEARYAGERYRLYRAQAYASRPSSPARLRELERASKLAQSRLERARRSQTTQAR